MGMRRRVGFLQVFSAAMAFMLLFSYVWTGSESAIAESKSEVFSSLNETQGQPRDKIDKDLLENFKKSDQVTFLLEFKDQVNTEEVAEKALTKEQKENATAAEEEVLKRSIIVSALRNKANETQINVKDFLKKQKESGHVKNYHAYFIVNMMAVTGTEEVAEELSKMGEIEKILPNRTRHINKRPEEIKKAVNSATKKVKEDKDNNKTDDSDNIEPNIAHIGAPEAWEQGIDGSGVVVGSIDTGVQWDHPALKEKYRGYNLNDPDNPDNEMNWKDETSSEDTPYDDIGHGSHTMGTMIGSEPDGSNQIGVAPGAQWIAVKAFTDAGGTDEDLLAAGQWMLAPTDKDGNTHPEMAPDVINNSWGGGAGKDEFYRDMVKNWREAGIFPVFAAGNIDQNNSGGPESVASPSNYPESFAVGAINNDDELADFSLRGPSPYDEIKPDVTAPGVNVRSSVPGNDYDGTYDGTSMATPAVSGTIALLKQADTSLSIDDLEQILMDTSKPLTDNEYSDTPNNGYGHGGLQAGNAVASVMSDNGTIKGTVTQEGNDNEPPTYNHDAANDAYEGMNLPLQIDVTDNVAITNVELQYRSSSDDDWKTVEADKQKGTHKDASYQAVIPGDDISKSSINYKWRIMDYGNNEVISDKYNVSVKSSVGLGYSTDFESDPGWISFGYNNSWERGEPTFGPKGAASGDNVYATNLDGRYPSESDAYLEMPPIDLSDREEAYLLFENFYQFEEDSGDYGEVIISTDQENWESYTSFSGQVAGWQRTELNLSDYAGQTIYVAFHMISDSAIEKAGWYLDDVSLNESSIFSTDQVKLGESKKVSSPFKEAKETSETNSNQLTSLPVGGTVSVLETENSTKSDPTDGSYSLSQPTGEYTLKAEAYGFYPETKTVDVKNDETSNVDFRLQEKTKGELEGTITNKQTEEPIENATISLNEDASIKPVETDENGHFSLKAYEGDYTMHISAPRYHDVDESIIIKGEDTTVENVKLKPFIGSSDEIGYDDGTAEDAFASFDAGNRLAVRMSLPKGKDHALVKGGKFKFWDDDFPTPGGNEFQVEIWDASGKSGAPGKKLGGPVDATAIRDKDKWTKVDSKDLGVIVDGDFYIVYVQPNKNTASPGLAADVMGPNANRSWMADGDVWLQSPEYQGNYMIRALVEYEVTEPVITSPKDDSFTKDSKVTVEGESAPNVDINISNNGDKVATTSTNDDGSFSKDIKLSKGKNKLTAVVKTENGVTDPSESVTVTLDQKKPELTIDSPVDGDKTNRETATIEGTVSDSHLDTVKVNGKNTEVHEDGTYSERIILDEGENNVEVVAKDMVGNTETQQIIIDAKYTAPEVNNVTPDSDKEVEIGESVKIEFDSEPGLKVAKFSILMPLTTSGVRVSNATELPVQETSEGHYVGYWTVQNNVKADGAKVEVEVGDDYGNTTNIIAKGELYIE